MKKVLIIRKNSIENSRKYGFLCVSCKKIGKKRKIVKKNLAVLKKITKIAASKYQSYTRTVEFL